MKSSNIYLNQCEESWCNQRLSLPFFQILRLILMLLNMTLMLGDAELVRQRFYRMSLDKREHFEAEYKYVLDNKIAELTSSWFIPMLAYKEARWYI